MLDFGGIDGFVGALHEDVAWCREVLGVAGLAGGSRFGYD